MEIRYTTISKTNNEDAYKIIDMLQNNRFMGIVCDGMGGIPLERLPVKRYVILYLTFGRSISVRLIVTQR